VRSWAISFQRESRHKESPSYTDVKVNSLRNRKLDVTGTKTVDFRHLIPDKKRKLGRAKHAKCNKTTANYVCGEHDNPYSGEIRWERKLPEQVATS
jgi:hypothetical protein